MLQIVGDSLVALTFVRNMLSTIFVFAMVPWVQSVGMANVFVSHSVPRNAIHFALLLLYLCLTSASLLLYFCSTFALLFIAVQSADNNTEHNRRDWARSAALRIRLHLEGQALAIHLCEAIQVFCGEAIRAKANQE